MSEDETQHAMTLVNFLNSRGATVEFTPIKTPENMKITDPCSAVTFALNLERDVTGVIIFEILDRFL